MCGKRASTESILPFEMNHEVSEEAINSSMLMETKRQCCFCGKFERASTDSVTLPQYLVVKSTV